MRKTRGCFQQTFYAHATRDYSLNYTVDMVSVEKLHSGYPLINYNLRKSYEVEFCTYKFGKRAVCELQARIRVSKELCDQVNEIIYQLYLSKSMLNVTLNFILMQEICKQCDVKKNWDLSMRRNFWF